MGKALERVVKKEIPEFFTEDIPKFATDLVEGPDRDKKDPTLKCRRKEIAALRDTFEARKEAFFKARGVLAATRRDYEALMESFASNEISGAPPLHVSERAWDMPGGPASTAPEAAEGTLRYVLGFVTFNLTEHAWHDKDNRQEHDYLNRQQAALKPVIAQFDRAIAEMAKEQAALETAIAEMNEAFAAAGVDPATGGVSELKFVEAEGEARLALAAKMLGDGVDPADIAFVTGLDASSIAALRPEAAAGLTDEQARALAAMGDTVE